MRSECYCGQDNGHPVEIGATLGFRPTNSASLFRPRFFSDQPKNKERFSKHDNANTNQSKHRIRIDSDRDAAQIAKQLHVEDPHWRNSIRQFMRLSNFSYGIVGATVFAALVLWNLTGRVDKKKTAPPTE
jgi:hypothetical protein